MERPSHTISSTSQPLSRRLPLFVLAASFQVAAAWLFTHGFATQVRTVLHDINVVALPDHSKETLPPPPLPVLRPVALPRIAQPIFNTEQAAGNGAITMRAGSAMGEITTGQPPMGITRAPLGIAATHTLPPYPPVARRQGAEDKVTLRLTVTMTGQVGQADIVTSSGNPALDEAAQHWIVTHWAYKPALDNGQPATAQVLATVNFNLKNDP